VNQNLTICLLGSFQVANGQEPVTGLERARLQELLAYLLLHQGQPIPRQQLAFLFWPDSTEEQARTNLRNLWYLLRRALPAADRCLVAKEMAVQWRADAPCRLDVAEFENGLAQAQAARNPGEQIDHLEEAITHYGGELLPGCYSDWLLPERERLAQAYGRSLSQLVNLHEKLRQYRPAIAHTRALLRHDPLREPAYADLMRLHALNGNRAAALHTYHTCTTTLRRELGVAPGQPLRELYERLLTQASAQESDHVPLPEGSAAIPLVGRESEWAQLQQTWRKAAARPRLVLLKGEAGIGKTRLAEALLEWVGRQGIPALTARCYATEGELAYAPIVAWLRSRPLPALDDPWLRELARLLPEILVEHSHLPPPEPLTKPWQRLRLFEALVRALLANQSPLLLFLDDLQWCDQDTLDWLHFLLTDRRTQENRKQLMVVTAVRSGEPGTGTKLSEWQAGLAHTGQLTALALAPLDQEATLALAGHVAERPFDPALAPLLHRETEGYPLFIVEMVRAGFAHTAPVADEDSAGLATLPTRVRQVLAARLAQLSSAARGVLEIAAIIGRAFTYDVLYQATDLSEDELVDCLDEGWRRRIIREQGEDTYDFSHDKLRDVVRDGLSQTRRRWLHGQVAQALETIHAGKLDQMAGVIATHYEKAGRIGPAIAYYDRAAAAARRIYAQEEALSALEKAIGLLPDLPPDAAAAELTAHLREALGDLRVLLAQHEAARTAYNAALAAVPDGEIVIQARLRRKIARTMENEQVDYNQVAAQYETAVALLGTPAADKDADWWEEWCQIQLDHLLLMYWWSRPDDMADQINQIRPQIERHGTPLQRASLFTRMGQRLNRVTLFAPSAEAVEYARAALDALPPATSPELLTSHQFYLGFNLLWYGSYSEAAAALEAALELAEQTGDVVWQARSLAYLTVNYRRQGQVGAVEKHARRCLAIAQAANMFDYIGLSQASLAWAAWQQEDLSASERLAQLALAAWHKHKLPYPLRWQALWPLLGVALTQARLEDAVSYARQLCDPAQQPLPTSLETPLTKALTAWEAGQSAEAHNLLHHALTTAKQTNFS
jgi:DNA-binding SARP family transcriptional activator